VEPLEKCSFVLAKAKQTYLQNTNNQKQTGKYTNIIAVPKWRAYSFSSLFMSPLHQKRTSSSLAPPIFYVTKNIDN